MELIKTLRNNVNKGIAIVTLSTILAGANVIAIKNGAEIDVRNIAPNMVKSIANLCYTGFRGGLGAFGVDIATKERVPYMLGAAPCLIKGMINEIVYLYSIPFPFKTKDIGKDYL